MSEENDKQKKLQELANLLKCSTEKSENVESYKEIIHLSKTLLIPRYFNFFTSLTTEAFETYLHIIQEVDTECLIGYVTGKEFKMFMDFWKKLSTLKKKENGAQGRMQKVVDIILGVADLNSPLKAVDTDHIDKFISCLKTALPFYERGAQGSHRNFANYLNNNITPVFEKLPQTELRKLNLLRVIAKRSLYPTKARHMLEQKENWVKKAPDRPVSLNHLPDYCKERLEDRGTCGLTEREANLLVDLQKLRYAQPHHTLEGPFILNDDGSVAQLCCKMDESNLLPFKRLLGVPWPPILGDIRDQQFHLLCWAYASSDQFSGVSQLHNWEKKHSPLCTWYLCSTCDTEELSRRAEANLAHHCYGFTIERALLHIQRYGIPRELDRIFDCTNHKRDAFMNKRGTILKSVRRIHTLEEALEELQWQPIGADLLQCRGMGDVGNGIYYGPAEVRTPNPAFLFYHSVVIAGLDIIDKQLVAVCKNSHGVLRGANGYINVSLETLHIPVGVDSTQKEFVRGSSEFMHLLSNFVTIDMDANEDEDENEDEDAGKDEKLEEKPKEYMEEDPNYEEYVSVSKRRKTQPYPN